MRTPITYLIFVLLTCTQTLQAQPIPFTRDTLHLQTPTGTLEATLLLPTPPPSESTPAKMPITLFLSGSGPTDRDGNNPMMQNNSMRMLAEGLAVNGIASIRYDKRGVGASKEAAGKEEDLRLETYIADARAWIDFIAKDERFGEITVAGHSLGSLIGMIAARNEKVGKFISLSGMSTSGAATLKRQLKDQPPLVLEYASPIIDSLEQGKIVEKIDPLLMSVFRPSVQPFIISWFAYNPLEEIAKLTMPVLIVQGSTDLQITVEDAVQLAAANADAELFILYGMNHVLKTAAADKMVNLRTYYEPNLPLHEGLLERIVSFILQGDE